MDPIELLRRHLGCVRQLARAGSATLYLPHRDLRFEPLLLHDGDLPPLPELASPAAAATFAASAASAARAAPPAMLTSPGADSVLLPLPAPGFASTPPADRGTTSEPAGAWLGLRFSGDDERARELVRRAAHGLDSGDVADSDWDSLSAMTALFAGHVSQVLVTMTDPVSGVPGRASVEATLPLELEAARVESRALSLLLVNPEDFVAVNERLGRDLGNRVVRELSELLRATVPAGDPVFRYGGVIFLVILRDCPPATAGKVARELHRLLAEFSYLGGEVELAFSVGVASIEAGATDRPGSGELVRRTDQALAAAKERGGAVVEWQPGLDDGLRIDRLAGLFTGDSTDDYRHMRLLWDTLQAIAVHPDLGELSRALLENLCSTFRPEWAGLYEVRDADPALVRAASPDGSEDSTELMPWQRELLSRAIRERRPQTAEHGSNTAGASDSERRTRSYAVPLLADSRSVGCLFITGRPETFQLRPSEMQFLEALCSQLAVAVDRLRLVEAERSRLTREHRQLQDEVGRLRDVVLEAKLIYRSPVMEALLDKARRVAPTDATILISGESGTGKELLARTVHELSTRKDAAYVIVDCGAIPSSLIESELFGRERGAYTGAQEARPGHLSRAAGGTVFLDEIGELPLDVQAKLLRFVQERQLTPVGGGAPRAVDVRILAATNRNLAEEVAAGRFREDLYYRLNVVSLQLPALRERREDIVHLARYFFESAVIQYQRSISRIAPSAELLLHSHGWPGNIRELHNCLLQAVLLCRGDELTADDLGLEAPPTELLAAASPIVAAAPAANPDEPPWERLRAALARAIEYSLGEQAQAPLGQWLGDDLLIAAHQAAAGQLRRSAEIAGIPETTFRRRFKRASEAEGERAARPPVWGAVRETLAELVARPGRDDAQSLLDGALGILLEELLDRLPDDVRTGSRLLGVTPPTFRRRVREARSQQAAVAVG